MTSWWCERSWLYRTDDASCSPSSLPSAPGESLVRSDLHLYTKTQTHILLEASEGERNQTFPSLFIKIITYFIVPCHLCSGHVCMWFASLTLLEFGNQIYVEILVAGGGSLLLLAEDANHMIVHSQSVSDSKVTHSSFVVLRHVNRLTRVLTWWRTTEVLNTGKWLRETNTSASHTDYSKHPLITHLERVNRKYLYDKTSTAPHQLQR